MVKSLLYEPPYQAADSQELPDTIVKKRNRISIPKMLWILYYDIGIPALVLSAVRRISELEAATALRAGPMPALTIRNALPVST